MLRAPHPHPGGDEGSAGAHPIRAASRGAEAPPCPVCSSSSPVLGRKPSVGHRDPAGGLCFALSHGCWWGSCLLLPPRVRARLLQLQQVQKKAEILPSAPQKGGGNPGTWGFSMGSLRSVAGEEPEGAGAQLGVGGCGRGSWSRGPSKGQRGLGMDLGGSMGSWVTPHSRSPTLCPLTAKLPPNCCVSAARSSPPEREKPFLLLASLELSQKSSASPSNDARPQQEPSSHRLLWGRAPGPTGTVTKCWPPRCHRPAASAPRSPPPGQGQGGEIELAFLHGFSHPGFS